MKQIPIDECPAGTYLDVAVAKAQYHGEHLVIDFKHRLFSTSDRAISCIKLSRYSTDIAPAWELVEELHDQSIFMCLSDENDLYEWYCGLTNAIDDRTISFEIGADTAPLAITRAYLKAKGVEFVEVADETNTD